LLPVIGRAQGNDGGLLRRQGADERLLPGILVGVDGEDDGNFGGSRGFDGPGALLVGRSQGDADEPQGGAVSFASPGNAGLCGRVDQGNIPLHAQRDVSRPVVNQGHGGGESPGNQLLVGGAVDPLAGRRRIERRPVQDAEPRLVAQDAPGGVLDPLQRDNAILHGAHYSLDSRLLGLQTDVRPRCDQVGPGLEGQQ